MDKYKQRAVCAEAEVAMLREMMEGVAAHWRASLAQYRQEANEHAAAQVCCPQMFKPGCDLCALDEIETPTSPEFDFKRCDFDHPS